MMDNPEPGATLHQKISGAREYEAAIDTLISHARNSLRIFDYNLADGGYNSLLRFELLRDFLLSSRRNQLDIVLHDTSYLTQYCPRILLLLSQFSHAIRVQQINPEARNIYDPLIVADTAHHLHRFHYDGPNALLVLNDITATSVLSRRLDEIWATSTPAVFCTTLGL
jgi:hypothetical protein